MSPSKCTTVRRRQRQVWQRKRPISASTLSPVAATESPPPIVESAAAAAAAVAPIQKQQTQEPSPSKQQPQRSNSSSSNNNNSDMHEMLHVARECSSRDAGGGNLFTFGEFCLFTTEMRHCYDREVQRPALLSKPSDKSSVDKKRCEWKMSKSSPKYEVFLGGSCNPTTWRQNVAIPMLKAHEISFYNPQVSHWDEALVELEYQAKQTASVLFFVLDRATRNVASMVEAAYLAGCRRNLVIVVDSYTGPGQLISGEAISEIEYQELSSGLLTVQDLIERQGIPVFGEINHALTCTAKILRENIRPQDLGLEDDVQPIRYPYLQLGDKLIKVHDAFVNTNSDHITLADARVAYKVVTNRELTTEELKEIVAVKKGIEVQELNGTELPLNEIRLTFDEFCLIIAEFKNQRLENRRLWEVFTHSVMSPLQKVISWALPRRPVRPVSSTGLRDIYLGGSLDNRVTWREEIAIPLLLKNVLTYFNPAASACSRRVLPMEAALVERSRVLLFVITSNTRGVSAMAVASHYIGLGCNVVLCIQMISEGTDVSGEELSTLAIKDYNRGRKYLIDQANKDGIPVFANIEEAVECAIEKCRSR